MKEIRFLLLYLIFTTQTYASWQYFSDVDFGIRNDKYGRGDFSAPRGGWTRKHTGVDYLLDYELKLYSPCKGKAKWIVDGPFGYSVDIICKSPFDNISLRNYYFSIRFSHVDPKSSFIEMNKKNKFVEIEKGDLLALVGSSGNAKGTKSHLHLEISVHKKFSTAKESRHSLKEGEATKISKKFIRKLKKFCSFAKDQERSLLLDERIDPYVLFKCLDIVPVMSEHVLQDDKLYPDFYKWKKHYIFK